jgi:putative ABC transport system permease protein
MLKKNIILAARLIRKDFFFSLIIIVGLAISYASFHMLWQYANDELASDQYHPAADRIYRLAYNWRYSDDGIVFKDENWGPQLFTSGPWFKSRYPEVEEYTRIITQRTFATSLNGHASNVYFVYVNELNQRISFKEEHTAYGDPNLFEFFSIPLIKGDQNSIMREPNTVALSRSQAKKYFGSDDPIGKTLLLNDVFSLKVTGVFQDLPASTHLEFDIVMSDVRFAKNWTAHDWSGQSHTYLRLRERTNLQGFIEKMNRDNKQFWSTMNFKEVATNFIQPLREVAFTDGFAGEDFRVKSRPILHILQAIAVFILFMGWINYLNLTFSRVMKRVKEIATRKTYGAGYRDFFMQFLAETIILNILAVMLAFILGFGALGVVSDYTHIPVPAVRNPISLSALYAGILLTGCLITAMYPAILGNAFSIRSLYSSGTKAPGKGRSVIGIITVFQYGISVVMIIWVFVMNLQMNFLLSADTGIDKNLVVIIDAPVNPTAQQGTQTDALLTTLRKIDGVSAATISSSVPGDKDFAMILWKRYGKESNAGLLTNGGVDENFVPFYGIHLAAGRNFMRDAPSQQRSILLSEVGLKRLGFLSADDAVGQDVVVGDWDEATIDSMSFHVIGVFKDYRLDPFIRTGSEREGLEGLFLTYKTGAFSWLRPLRISIRIEGADTKRIMNETEKEFSSVFPGTFFNWYFLEDHMNKGYEYHENMRHQILLFTLLAIFISCLGLLGSTRFMAIEKTKELGIRKVLGANASQLGMVLVKTTALHIILATVIGIPLGYYFVVEYLRQYIVHVPLAWWYFAVPLIMLMTIFLLTITPILFRAWRTNPVEALK